MTSKQLLDSSGAIIEADGSFVVIKDAAGNTIGRFGVRNAEVFSSEGSCLFYIDGRLGVDRWESFKAAMAKFQAVNVPDEFRPKG